MYITTHGQKNKELIKTHVNYLVINKLRFRVFFYGQGSHTIFLRQWREIIILFTHFFIMLFATILKKEKIPAATIGIPVAATDFLFIVHGIFVLLLYK